MARKIYKFPLGQVNRTVAVAEMPWGARVLDVQLQDDVHVAWAEIDSEETRLVRRRFHLFYTGMVIPADSALTYLRTDQRDGLVFHIYLDTKQYTDEA